MPSVEISCFCGSSKAESNDVRLAGMNPSEWVVLPGCGHFCHQVSLPSVQTELHVQCLFTQFFDDDRCASKPGRTYKT